MKTGNSVTAVPQTAPETQKTRMDWPDVARGLSIVGVVLLHVTLAIPEAEYSFLAEMNHFLDPLRMPLFFMVSGFFSVKVLHMSFEQLFKRRLWFFLVPYLVWTPIELSTHSLQGWIYFDQPMPGWIYYAHKVVDGTNMYWFLYFLVCFNLLLWATRKMPAWAIATLVAVGPWLFMPMFSEFEFLRKILIYLPAFFIGAYFRPLIIRFAEAASRPKAVVVAMAFYVLGMGVTAVADILVSREPGPTQLWFISWKNEIAALLGGELSPFDMAQLSGTLVRLFSLPAGVVLAVWLAKIPPVARTLMFFGRHTLVIYIGHAVGLTVLFNYIFRWNVMVIDNQSTNPLNWTITWMIIAFALAMAGSYLVHLISRVPFVGWTLVPPRLPESHPAPTTGTRPTLSVRN